MCKVCFKDIKQNSLLSFFNPGIPICPNCFHEITHLLQIGKIGGCELVSLAPYKEPLSSLIIQYKENLDFELYPVFLFPYASLLRLYYQGYYCVFVPSCLEKRKKRGFNHLEWMFKSLRLEVLDVLTKDDSKDQKKKNALERKESSSLFHIKDSKKIEGKKILLIDDVITTGTSLLSCLRLIKTGKPKRIKALVLTNDVPLASYRTLE